MVYECNDAKKLGLIIICALGLSGCTTAEIRPSNDPDAVFRSRPVETFGETIAREQQGEDGCLVAGNLNKGPRCRDLTELLTPSAHPGDPEL